MDFFGKNLCNLRKKKGIGQKEIAGFLKVGTSAISSYEKGLSYPTFSGLLKIVDYFNVSLDDLVYKDMSSSNKKDVRKGFIPYYYLPASAGDYDMLLQQTEPDTFYSIPELQDCKAILPVIGTSMKGVIESGDLIAIKERDNNALPDPEKPYLIVTADNRMIKYLHKRDYDTIIARSSNKDVEDIIIPIEDVKHVYAIRGIIRFFF
ncbi:MAG: LexA family transcriptional regulator [Bacteroidales bacterium]|nr:LexA family transcriptional regulator [Bacteroidales bacterium]